MFSLKWSVSVPFLGKATKGGTLTDGECLFMNRLLNILLVLPFLTIVLGDMSYHREHFHNKFNLQYICKAEVSDYKGSHYQTIDTEAFLKALRDSKQTVAKFIPHKEVVLFDGDGHSFKLLFSEDNRIFHSAVGDFRLSRRNALILSKLFKN